MGEKRKEKSVKNLVEKLETDHLENVCVDGKIILTLIFKSWTGARNGFILLRKERGGGLL
jgi:hypothetical protein